MSFEALLRIRITEKLKWCGGMAKTKSSAHLQIVLFPLNFNFVMYSNAAGKYSTCGRVIWNRFIFCYLFIPNTYRSILWIGCIHAVGAYIKRGNLLLNQCTKSGWMQTMTQSHTLCHWCTHFEWKRLSGFGQLFFSISFKLQMSMPNEFFLCKSRSERIPQWNLTFAAVGQPIFYMHVECKM